MRALYPRQQCSINLSQPCIHPRLSLQPPWATHKPILLQEMHVCQHVQCSQCMHSSLKPCTPADECCNLRQGAKAPPPPKLRNTTAALRKATLHQNPDMHLLHGNKAGHWEL